MTGLPFHEPVHLIIIFQCLIKRRKIFETPRSEIKQRESLQSNSENHFNQTARITSIKQRESLQSNSENHFNQTARITSIKQRESLQSNSENHFNQTARITSIKQRESLQSNSENHFNQTVRLRHVLSLIVFVFLQVINYENEEWGKGWNQRTGEDGVFPLAFVQKL